MSKNIDNDMFDQFICVCVCSDGTAIGGSSLSKDVDYIQSSGTLEFKHQETYKTIEIKINKEAKVCSYRCCKLSACRWCKKYVCPGRLLIFNYK